MELRSQLLSAITKKSEETYTELAKRIRVLSLAVYPNSGKQATKAGKDAFIQAIDDPEVQLTVMTKNPDTLAGCESYFQGHRRKGKAAERRPWQSAACQSG